MSPVLSGLIIFNLLYDNKIIKKDLYKKKVIYFFSTAVFSVGFERESREERF